MSISRGILSYPLTLGQPILPDGLFLLPVCTTKERLAKILNALNTYKVLSRDPDFDVMIDVLEAMAHVNNPSAARCLEGEVYCYEYDPSYSFISFAPQNPLVEPNYVPPGYTSPPFVVVEQGNVVLETLGFEPGDVYADINSFPLFTGWQALLTQGLPRFRVNFTGPSEIELHLLKIPLGGNALITIDGNPFNVEIISTELKIGIGDTEIGVDTIKEFKFTDTDDHFIDVTFIPVLDEGLVPLKFGGGIRKIVVCGNQQMLNVDVRQNPVDPCSLQKKFGTNEWIEFAKIDACGGFTTPTFYTERVNNKLNIYVTFGGVGSVGTLIGTVFDGEDGEGIDGLNGEDGIDGINGEDGSDGLNGTDGTDCDCDEGDSPFDICRFAQAATEKALYDPLLYEMNFLRAYLLISPLLPIPEFVDAYILYRFALQPILPYDRSKFEEFLIYMYSLRGADQLAFQISRLEAITTELYCPLFLRMRSAVIGEVTVSLWSRDLFRAGDTISILASYFIDANPFGRFAELGASAPLLTYDPNCFSCIEQPAPLVHWRFISPAGIAASSLIPVGVGGSFATQYQIGRAPLMTLGDIDFSSIGVEFRYLDGRLATGKVSIVSDARNQLELGQVYTVRAGDGTLSTIETPPFTKSVGVEMVGNRMWIGSPWSQSLFTPITFKITPGYYKRPCISQTGNCG